MCNMKTDRVTALSRFWRDNQERMSGFTVQEQSCQERAPTSGE